MDLKAYLKRKRGLVDVFLKAYFRHRLKPAELQSSMCYSVMAGGKRLRPILALSSYEACGKKNSGDIVRYACALEFIHTYSLIHDDLPAMDDDDLRRGKPTNHVVFGEAIAILAGDGLLTEAFRLLSEPSGKIGAGALLEAIGEVSRGAGIMGMVAGQAQDILSEDSAPDAKTLSFIHRHKTGALITSSVRLGAILAGAKGKKLDSLTKYACNIGLAFQIVDDILDIKGTTESLGKPSGSDIKKKKMTYPALYGLGSSEKKASALIGGALEAIKGFPESAEPLRELARYIVSRHN